MTPVPTPVWDDTVKGWLVQEVETEAVYVIPMIFNHRVVIGVRGDDVYDHGWCYPTGAAAVLAAMVWNPQTEDEPDGYVKRATAGHRRAPG